MPLLLPSLVVLRVLPLPPPPALCCRRFAALPTTTRWIPKPGNAARDAYVDGSATAARGGCAPAAPAAAFGPAAAAVDVDKATAVTSTAADVTIAKTRRATQATARITRPLPGRAAGPGWLAASVQQAWPHSLCRVAYMDDLKNGAPKDISMYVSMNVRLLLRGRPPSAVPVGELRYCAKNQHSSPEPGGLLLDTLC